MIILFKYYVNVENCDSFRDFGYIYIYIYRLVTVRGPFPIAQPRVVRWRGDLTRPGFCLGSFIRNSTLGHVVQWLLAYF